MKTAAQKTVIPANVTWHGWRHGDKAAWFYEREPDTKCVCPCEACGFSYLDEDGIPFEYGVKELETKNPLCGTW